MKRIKLLRGEIALIDDEDFDLVSKYRWRKTTFGYAIAYRKGVGDRIWMHRLIMNPDKGVLVDHRDRNKLNNRRSNLRIANKSLNAVNSKIHTNNTSGVTGVSFDKARNKWKAFASQQNKFVFIGRFDSKRAAINARVECASKLYGSFA